MIAMGTVKEWFGKHLYFSVATMCIRGLVFSHSFVEHAIMSMLIIYLTDNWKHEHFQMAAVVENIRDGLSDIMVIFLAHMPHTYRGCFKVIVTTNAAFVVGLGIIWSTEHMSNDIAARVFYGAAVLLTLGKAGRSAALEEFLDEQYLSEQDKKKCIDDKKLQDRQNALWNLPWFLGAVVALSLLQETWERTFQRSTIVMGVFYLFFWVGYSYYFIYSKSPRATEAETMYPIEEAKRDETCIDTEELAEPAGRGNFWGVMTKKMKDRKHLRYEILAMWLTFLVYSVVTAAGGTFFFEQLSSNLRHPIKNAGIILNLLGSSSKYISSFLWELLIPKKWKSNTRVRIGCGMVCTVLCCVAAWQVEIRRLNEVKKQGVGDDTSATISMSIFWLVPQFSLLGIMEGLAIEGLIDFFVDRVAGDDDKAMVRYYGSHTTDFVIGVGKLLAALSIVAFRRRWFNDNINMSRLDKYYRALTFMRVISFFFYVCVSTCYCTKDVSQDHAREENGTNSHRIEQQESPPSQQNLSTSQQEPSPPSPQEPSQLELSPPSQQEQPLHSHQDFQYHQQLSPMQHQHPYQESPLSPQNYRPQGYPPLYPLQAYSPQSSLPQPQYPLSEKTKDVPYTGGQ